MTLTLSRARIRGGALSSTPPLFSCPRPGRPSYPAQLRENAPSLRDHPFLPHEGALLGNNPRSRASGPWATAVSSPQGNAQGKRNEGPHLKGAAPHSFSSAETRVWAYSHSMVPGGFEVTSSTTRLTSGTWLVILFEMRASTSYGTRVQSAVIASSEETGRSTIG